MYSCKIYVTPEKDSNNFYLDPTKIHNETQKQLPRLRHLEIEMIEEILFGNFLRFMSLETQRLEYYQLIWTKLLTTWKRERLLQGLVLRIIKNKFSRVFRQNSFNEDHKRDSLTSISIDGFAIDKI